MNTFPKFLENTDNITQVLFDKTTENEEFPINARTLTQNKEFIKDEVRVRIADPSCKCRILINVVASYTY